MMEHLSELPSGSITEFVMGRIPFGNGAKSHFNKIGFAEHMGQYIFRGTTVSVYPTPLATLFETHGE